MPGYDKTGPMGKGSRTGRGLGKCKPAKEEREKDDKSLGLGRGGNPRGGGRGFGGGKRMMNSGKGRK